MFQEQFGKNFREPGINDAQRIVKCRTCTAELQHIAVLSEQSDSRTNIPFFFYLSLDFRKRQTVLLCEPSAVGRNDFKEKQRIILIGVHQCRRSTQMGLY